MVIFLAALFYLIVFLITAVINKYRKKNTCHLTEDDTDFLYSDTVYKLFRQAIPNLKQLQKRMNRFITHLESRAGTGSEFELGIRWLADNKNRLLSDLDILAMETAHLRQKVPVYRNGPARIYCLMSSYIKKSEYILDENELADYLYSFNQKTPLTLREGMFIQFCLRCAFLQKTVEAAEAIYNTVKTNESVQTFINELNEGKKSEQDLYELLNHTNDTELYYYTFIALSGLENTRATMLNEKADLALHKRGLDKKTLMAQVNLRHAKLSSQASNCIKSMIGLNDFLSEKIIETAFLAEGILLNDPSGTFEQSDKQTRSLYRNAAEQISLQQKTSEIKTLHTAQELALNGLTPYKRELGAYLIGAEKHVLEDRLQSENPNRTLSKAKKGVLSGKTYFLIIFALTLFLLLPLVYYVYKTNPENKALSVIFVALFAFIPVLGMAETFATSLFNIFTKPALIPRLDEKYAVSPDNKTAVVIPCLLSGKETVSRVTAQLEKHYLSNRCEHTLYVLLGDFADSQAQTQPEDEEIISYAREKIDSYNKKYNTDIFLYYHRPRRRSENAQRRRAVKNNKPYVCYERKRGALLELTKLCAGQDCTGFLDISSPFEALKDVNYILTLDADTQLPPGTLVKLIGSIAHPLIKAEYDSKSHRIRHGYGIIQASIGTTVPSAHKSCFAQLFAPRAGLDSYSCGASEVYQDLFGESTFTGKGIYSVKAYMDSIGDSLPENTILSHDLLEGAYLRCATASDIKLIDTFPCSLSSYYKRIHRWTRGDYQQLPWLFRYRRYVSLLTKWKIIGNIRRALFSASLLALLLFSVLGIRGTPWIYTLFVLNAVFFPLIMDLITKAILIYRSPERKYSYRDTIPDIGNVLMRMVYTFLFLPYDAYVTVDAGLRALYRMTVSHKKMLEWTTSADSDIKDTASIKYYLKNMWSNPVYGTVYFLLCLSSDKGIFIAFILLVLWSLAPMLGQKISLSIEHIREKLRDGDMNTLRILAARTFRYFYLALQNEYHYLPPDNFQEYPYKGFADRTSPTNIGFGIISPLCALQLRFIPVNAAVDMLYNAVMAADSLEKWHGNLYNWYTVSTQKPMRPLYVSSVDSGNFCCSLLCAQELLKRADHIYFYDSNTKTNFSLFLESIMDEDADKKEMYLHLLDYKEQIIKTKDAKSLSEVLRCFINDPNIDTVDGADYIKWAFSAWVHTANYAFALSSDGMTSLYEIIKEKDTLLQKAEQNKKPETIASLKYFTELTDKINSVKDLIQNMINECDLTVLYNDKKKLFSIGYNIEKQELSKHYYDLLASECRLFSYYAIAFGVVPAEHWFRLGRPMSRINDEPIVLSWSGTMFEYLMPELFLETHHETLMGKTIEGVISAQVNYGKRERIPWGVSESAFHAKDLFNEYKYKAFGVYDTSLNINRHERVISPYSTVLAIEEAPQLAMDNLARLVELGAAGRLGMIEAVDFTKRSTAAEPSSHYELVQTYMSHHQGMGLCSLTNMLTNQSIRKAFMGNHAIKAVDLLLAEQIPQGIAPRVNLAVHQKPRRLTLKTRTYNLPTPVPEVNVLSNGVLKGIYTANGAAGLYFKDAAVTLLNRDKITEQGGSHVYVKDCNEEYAFSPCYLPLGEHASDKACEFKLGQCSYTHERNGLKTRMDIVVSSEFDVELREITIVNHKDTDKEIIITLAHDIVLSREADYLAHPVYNNLFVETYRKDQVLSARRKGKNEDEYLYAAIAVLGDYEECFQYTNRYHFYGRNNINHLPERILFGNELEGDVKTAPLEPVLAQSVKIILPPKSTKTVTFITAAADNRSKLELLIGKYTEKPRFKQEAELSYANALIRERRLHFTEAEQSVFSQLLNNCFYLTKLAQSDEDSKIDLLWSLGISGDAPVMLIKYDENSDFYTLTRALKLYEAVTTLHVRLDLILMDYTENDYLKTEHSKVETAIGMTEHGEKDRMIHHLCNYNEQDIFKRLLPMCVYCIDCSQSIHSLAEKTISEQADCEQMQKSAEGYYPLSVIFNEKPDKLFDNGYGCFNGDGDEYVITLANGASTPTPWSNVIANELFGTVVCENGGGFTYFKNSSLCKLTNAYNNPVQNPPSECIYLRDEETAEFWTVTQSPINRGDQYQIKHGFGYTEFSYCGMGLEQHQIVFVHKDLPIKLYSLKLINTSDASRELSVTYYADMIIGSSRRESYKFIYAGEEKEAVYIKRAGGGYAYIYMPKAEYSYDKAGFLGLSGGLSCPAGMKTKNLSTAKNSYDLCLCARSFIHLDQMKETSVYCILGYAETLVQMKEQLELVKSCKVSDLLNDVKTVWKNRLGTIKIQTPDKAFDLLFNGWLLYQTYSSRMFARSGFYQMGGAIGFRDQLQDCLALLYSSPDRVRKHILLCAEHQFISGDVQHWWHPERTGIRTKIKDDLLFLPYVACIYARTTGDYNIFNEKAPYLEGREVGDAHDVYETPPLSDIKETLYQHCTRAIKKACTFGSHGLPLIGTGDWNDGLDSVGDQGKGESVWLGWLMLDILSEFIQIADRYDDAGTADEYKETAYGLKQAIEQNAWDGRWYKRAFCDDGTPLGSIASKECKIDSITQSWSVISGFGDFERAREAMNNAYDVLVDRQHGLIRLLWPPFETHKPYVGYIQRYLRGLRENGGQYTHSAAWMIKAFTMLGEGDKACELFSMINPIYHSQNHAQALTYAVEPYVVAGDVYANEDNMGRGGWTWYTGSSAWLYIVALENILGFKLEGNTLELNPCIPCSWEVNMQYLYMDTAYNISIHNPDRRQTGVKSITLDGELQKDRIILVNDLQEHKIKVIMD